jgi:hypothetical protein
MGQPIDVWLMVNK